MQNKQEAPFTREQFISKFSLFISQNLGSDVAMKVTPVFMEFMSDYDVTARNTEIALYQNYIPYWIEEYFVSKYVSGCKDNSMKDYALHLNSFFEYLRIPVNEINECDIQKFLGHADQNITARYIYNDEDNIKQIHKKIVR